MDGEVVRLVYALNGLRGCQVRTKNNVKDVHDI